VVPPAQCTNAAFNATSGRVRQLEMSCVGPWTVDQQVCSDVCEAVSIFRWTGTKWEFRGDVNQYCLSGFIWAGMPPAVAEQIDSPETDYCELDPSPQSSPEPVSGDLAYGMVGERVRRMQQALIDFDLLHDAADGQFGKNTLAALIDFGYLSGALSEADSGRISSEWVARVPHFVLMALKVE
jgi:hypothetical protein